MSIKGKGKMSSREGTVVYIDDLLDDAKSVILEKLSNREFTKEEKE
jgi:arginyl-tRNA synthetase